MKTVSAIAVFSLLSPALQAAQDPAPRPAQAPRTENEFNPAITVFHDMLLRLDNKDVVEIEDGEEIHKDDRFLLRETEVDFRAAIDPYADGVLIVGLEQEVPGEFEVGVEEGYVRIKSLPFAFWEEPPLGAKIKVGRFLPAVGRQNRLHTHDLPQPQRGLAFENFIGEHGYFSDGASAEMFLPSFGETSLILTTEIVQGGGWEFAPEGTGRPAFVANLSWFTTIAEDHDLEIALIGTYGSNDEEGRRQARLLSADFLYKWKPRRQGEWSSVVLAGQAFYGSREFEEFDDTTAPPILIDEGTHRAFGFFVYGQYQLDRRWYAGLRYDWTEYLEDRELVAGRVTPYVACYLSEFFRLRAAYEFTRSDVPEDDDLQTFLLELTVVFGSHPPHPYWVNQ